MNLKHLGGILAVAVLLWPGRSGAEPPFRHELTPEVVLLTSDPLRKTVLGGFEYSFHATETWWFGVGFAGGTASADPSDGTAVEDGDRFLEVLGTLYFNIPVLVGGKDGLHADLYTSIGGGRMWIGPETPFFGFLGGGMLLHTGWSWLTVRFDLKGTFYALENSQGSDYASDLVLSIGPSFVF